MDVVITHPFLAATGGVERVVLEIAKEFNPIIYSVVYENKKTFDEFREFDIRILPKNTLEKPFFFLKNDRRRHNAIAAGFRYYNYKINEDYDVINAHGTPSEWIRNKNERVCWFVHSPNREAFDLYSWRMKKLPLWKRPVNWGLIQAYKLAESKVVPRIETICANSEITNERIKKYLKRNDGEIISPGIEPKEYDCETYDKFFFYPSRLVPEKRFEIAIEAFKKFYRSTRDKKWKLIIAGFLGDTKGDAEYLKHLKLLITNYPIEIKTNISESVLKKLYSTCHATLFSAINEDWGLVPLESMASSKPCISINEGGPMYSIIDGQTGFLVNDANEMAEKLLALADNSQLNEKIGKQGRVHVIKKYTWRKFIERLRKVFRDTNK